MIKDGTYTVSDYAKQLATEQANGNGSSLESAQAAIEARIRKYILRLFSADKEVEFPFGSGVYYLLVGEDRIQIRLDADRVARAKEFAARNRTEVRRLREKEQAKLRETGERHPRPAKVATG